MSETILVNSGIVDQVLELPAEQLMLQLQAELADSKLLQAISTEITFERNAEVLYDKLLDAAVAIMRSDYSSMQMFHPERGASGQLQLLGFRGFSPYAAEFWEWVTPESASTCGVAMHTHQRVIVTDIEDCDFLTGTEDLATYRQTGIRAVQSTPLISRSGKIVGMLSTHWSRPHQPTERDLRLLDILARQAADLIERQQAEQALRDSEEKYRSLFDSIDQGFCTIEVLFNQENRPIDYRFLLVNRAFERQTGIPDAVGRRMREIAPLHEEHWFENYGKVALTGEAMRFESAAAQFNRFYEVCAWRVGLAEERKVAILFNDITKRRQAEEALRESEMRWRTMTEALPNLVWTDLPDGHCDWLSSQWARYTGIPEKELLGLNWLDRVIHPDDRQRTLACWQAACQDRGEYDLEYRIRRHDGQYRWFKTRGVPVRDKAGRILHWFGTCTDIEDIKRAEERERALIERTLTATAKFEAIFNQSGIFAAIMDLDGNLQEVNQLAIDYCGYSREQVLGRPFWETPWWRGSKEVQERIRVATHQAAAGGVFRETLRYWLANGNERIVDFAMHPIRDKSGVVRFLHPTGIDITERKRAEARLRESEERFRAVIDNSPTIIFVKDCDGRYLLINERYRELFHITEQDVVGRSDFENFPLDIAQMYRENDLEVMRAGRPIEVEEVALHDDGPHTYISNKFPLRREDGTIYAVAGISTEITERKRAEESAGRLAAIVEHSNDAIISTDVNGIITSWNRGAERLFGYMAMEAIGRPVSILVPENPQMDETAILDKIRRGQTIENYETVRRCQDGTLLDISLTVSPIKDKKGEVIGASKVARDITDRVRAKEELEKIVAERTASLREAVAQLEEFSYTVSHDLRAPLRGMQAYSEALLQDHSKYLSDDGKYCLERIAKNASLLDQMVQDVLTFSRVARSEFEPQKVEVAKLVRRIVEQYPGMQVPEAQIEIGPLHDVLGHEPSLTQAFANLLNNAIKFVPPNVTPKVRVWSELNSERVRFWISDNGIGIEPKYQHRLFKMFERIRPGKTYEGTGVGLAIVRKAVERMGGSVGVESDGLSGTRFWFELKPANPV